MAGPVALCLWQGTRKDGYVEQNCSPNVQEAKREEEEETGTPKFPKAANDLRVCHRLHPAKVLPLPSNITLGNKL